MLSTSLFSLNDKLLFLYFHSLEIFPVLWSALWPAPVSLCLRDICNCNQRAHTLHPQHTLPLFNFPSCLFFLIFLRSTSQMIMQFVRILRHVQTHRPFQTPMLITWTLKSMPSDKWVYAITLALAPIFHIFSYQMTPDLGGATKPIKDVILVNEMKLLVDLSCCGGTNGLR